MVNTRWWLGLGLLGAGRVAVADEIEVTDCGELEDGLRAFCMSDNVITLQAGLNCSLDYVHIDGDCTIRAERPCEASVTNGSSGPSFFVHIGTVTFDGLALSCDARRSTDVLVSVADTAIFKNACLDGSACGEALVGGDETYGPADALTFSASSLTGPVLTRLEGARSLFIEQSIIQAKDDQESPVIEAENIADVEIAYSVVNATGDARAVISLTGGSDVRLHHNALLVSGAAAALAVDDTTVSLSQNTAIGYDEGGPAITASGSALTLSRDLFQGFDTVMVDDGSVIASDDDRWVSVRAAAASGGLDVSLLSLAEAGLSALPEDERFCFFPPDCDELEDCEERAICLDAAPVWPEGGCSALVLTDDAGAFADLVGLVGGLGADAPPTSPPWATIIGDGDGDGEPDDDGDGWVDDLDTWPDDARGWHPSWYRMENGTCLFVDNTCEALLPSDLRWRPSVPDIVPMTCDLPLVAAPRDWWRDDPGDEAGATLSMGSGCGARTVRSAGLLSPTLLLLCAARARRRRQR